MKQSHQVPRFAHQMETSFFTPPEKTPFIAAPNPIDGIRFHYIGKQLESISWPKKLTQTKSAAAAAAGGAGQRVAKSYQAPLLADGQVHCCYRHRRRRPDDGGGRAMN